MRLSDTIAELGRRRRNAGADASVPTAARLTACPPPRDNPGRLDFWGHVPANLPAGAPLVVVLHGCTQNAAGYDAGAGWSRLADRHGFALLLPEQNRANNSNLCFNWFQPEDVARGRGEAASIAAMAEAMIERHQLDRGRVFVTGLSAGGAMASVMLAAYPDLFAAGAIIAGLPYGGASNLREALDAMAGRLDATGPVLGARVRAASPHSGSWPRVQIWQGSADHLVVPGNAEAIVRQWADVHGLAGAKPVADVIDGHRRRRWTGPDGRVLIEQVTVAGMGHGTPLSPGTEAGQSGTAGPHMLDVGLSSTDHIAAFFGVAPVPAATVRKPSRAAPARRVRAGAQPAQPAGGVQTVIEDALRAAGLMR